MKPLTETTSVLSHDDLGAGYRFLRLRAPGIAAAATPGQFVQLRVPGLEASALRRPFSICDADPATGTLSILYKRVGRGTAAMAALAPGDEADLMGPLGRGFPLPPPDAVPVLVGGGYGVAPLYFLARTMLVRARRSESLEGLESRNNALRDIHLFVGGRTATDLLLLDDFRALGVTVHPATNDGSLGATGLVTAPLDEFLVLQSVGPSVHQSVGPSVHQSVGPSVLQSVGPTERPEDRTTERPKDRTTERPTDRKTERPNDRTTVLYACGPAPMLRALDERALAGGFPAWLSLDRRMACGVGACCGCAQKVRGPDGAVRVAMVCSDGPVFPRGAIVWD